MKILFILILYHLKLLFYFLLKSCDDKQSKSIIEKILEELMDIENESRVTIR